MPHVVNHQLIKWHQVYDNIFVKHFYINHLCFLFHSELICAIKSLATCLFLLNYNYLCFFHSTKDTNLATTVTIGMEFCLHLKRHKCKNILQNLNYNHTKTNQRGWLHTKNDILLETFFYQPHIQLCLLCGSFIESILYPLCLFYKGTFL